MEIVTVAVLCIGSLLIAERLGHERRAVERSAAYREAITGAIREPIAPFRNIPEDVAPGRSPAVATRPPLAVPDPA